MPLFKTYSKLIKIIKVLSSRCRRCVFLFLGLFVGCTQHPHVKELTELENQYLESFFRHLLETTTAGYVLYGERPLFWCYFQSVENTIPGTLEHRDAVLFAQGIHAWKKLNIQSKNYLLIFFTSATSPFQEFILINKKAFEDIVRKNLSLFQYKLGIQVNEQSLLNSLLSPNGFSTLLKGHEALQGILFGYGVENSLTYERGNALRKKALNSSTINPPFQFTDEPKTPDELKEKIINYVASQGGAGQDLLDELSDFSFYIPENEEEITPKIPFSFHLKSEESKKLLAAYKESEKTVIHLQAQKNFVDKVLERLKQ